MDILYPAERHQQILDLLAQLGRVTVANLSERFAVSEVTIRTDLQLLAEQGLLIRTHGGAVPADRAPELALTLRRQQQVAEKERIGMAAAALVENGEAIFLDTSSTSLSIAAYLRRHRDLTILTNSLALAQSLLHIHSITVVVAGGVLQRDTVSFVGLDGLAGLSKFNIQKGFFGAHGLNDREGLTDVSAAEAEVKRHVIPLCRQVFAVLDATKWGRAGLASFAQIDQLHAVITNEPVPPVLAGHVHGLGVQVMKV
ncbi:MAG: DeoR/GlpR family DNA-binding transcription regulator [Chloroflexota bacterium]